MLRTLMHHSKSSKLNLALKQLMTDFSNSVSSWQFVKDFLLEEKFLQTDTCQ